MKLIIDISKDRYDEIMSMDWKNCRLLFDEEIRAIHDGKALEQEPCVDVISRQAVLDLPRIKTHNVWGNVIYESVDVENVRQLPSVTPQSNMDSSSEKPNKWIPCSERLPNFAGVYLVTRYFPNNVMNPTYLVDACFFDGTDTWHNDNRINHDRKYLTNVVAWLEEPEPYKEIPTGAEGGEE